MRMTRSEQATATRALSVWRHSRVTALPQLMLPFDCCFEKSQTYAELNTVMLKPTSGGKSTQQVHITCLKGVAANSEHCCRRASHDRTLVQHAPTFYNGRDFSHPQCAVSTSGHHQPVARV